MLLMLAGLISFVEILQVKYLNNLIEQDHRFIKKITNPMMESKLKGANRLGCLLYAWGELIDTPESIP
jgi:transposase-like protein